MLPELAARVQRLLVELQVLSAHRCLVVVHLMLDLRDMVVSAPSCRCV